MCSFLLADVGISIDFLVLFRKNAQYDILAVFCQTSVTDFNMEL